MPRFAIGIEYDGGRYRGWQSHPHAPGIQSELERALARVADAAVAVTAAGRTDAGVHASMQVAHFDAPVDRGERGWVLGANSNLPADVTALWLRTVPGTFHARHDALERSYRYVILNRPVRPAIERGSVCWVREPLDAGAMHAAGQALLGEHDFSAFRSAECQSRTPIRRVVALDVRRSGEHVVVDVTANAFLHHMVRNVAGALIAVGRGEERPQWVASVLATRDRRRNAATAPPQGLYLQSIRYPDALGLPSAGGRDPLAPPARAGRDP
jgi:tRNA pseudouridine38-40 synthase